MLYTWFRSKLTKRTKGAESDKAPKCEHLAPSQLVSPPQMLNTSTPSQQIPLDDHVDTHSQPSALGHLDEKGRCVQCLQEKRTARTYRIKIIAGLVLPFALQALDVTIIASALPWIAAEFGEIVQLNWIISAFNLTSAAFIPFWGQMTDIFGRQQSLLTAIIIMMIGSALCTGAPTRAFPVLLLGRGLQGLGCAGLNVIIRVILADKVSLKENAKNTSIFSFVAGMSYGVGPVIGGYLVNSNWRWCFGINLPICAAAIVLIFVILRKELLGPQPVRGLSEDIPSSRLTGFKARILTIDIGGQVLFLFGFGLVILALTWAGATYAWESAAVLTSLIAGFILVAAFVVWERLMAPGHVLDRMWPAQQPMLPWRLIANKDTGLLFYINFATGAAMYSVLYFCNLYFTIVKQWSAAKAGVQLLFYTPGLGVGVYLSMYFCNGWPRQTFLPLMLGSIIEAVGVGLMAWAIWMEHNPTIFGMMSLTGAGTGLRFMPGSLHAIGYFPQHIATVVALMGVALPFGGTLAGTLMATVFNNASGIKHDSPLMDLDTLSEQAPEVIDVVTQSAKMGLVWAFVSIVPLMIFCVIAAGFLGNVQITPKSMDPRNESHRGDVYRGVYLLKLLGRRDGDQNRELVDAEKNGRGARQATEG